MSVPWWALLVGLTSGFALLFSTILLIAFCCYCKIRCREDPEKQQLDDNQTASNRTSEHGSPLNNNEKAYFNHAIVHDEYTTPPKRNTSSTPPTQHEEMQLEETEPLAATPKPDTPPPEQHSHLHSIVEEECEPEIDNTSNTSHPEQEEPHEREVEEKQEIHEEPEAHHENEVDEEAEVEEVVVPAVSASLNSSKVSAVRLVREGEFGAVYEGEYEEGKRDIPVIIKTFLDHARYGEEEKQELVEAGMLLHDVKHDNIMSPLGMTYKHDVPYVVYPSAELLDLKTYISDPHHVLSVRHLMDFTLNISEGVSYMHENDIVHKDLATRNCWVTQSLHIMVCDGALSRDLFPDDYETTRDISSPMPIRWMAPECLASGSDFSTMSDVWSLGILLWELFKRGMNRPYEELTAQKVADNVMSGDILMKPFFAPDDVYRVMGTCWAKQPEDRTDLPTIINEVRTILNRRTSYGSKRT